VLLPFLSGSLGYLFINQKSEQKIFILSKIPLAVFLLNKLLGLVVYSYGYVLLHTLLIAGIKGSEYLKTRGYKCLFEFQRL